MIQGNEYTSTRRRRLERVILVTAMSFSVLVFSSCGQVRQAVTARLGQTVTESVSQHFTVGANPAIVITSDDGSIEVAAGAGDMITITAEKHAPTTADLQQMQVFMTGENGEVRAGYRAGGKQGRNRSVSFKVTAPKGSRVELQTGDGSILLDGLASDVSARTNDGSIKVTNQNGRIQAKTGDGSVAIDGRLTGQSTVNTGDGSIAVTLPADSSLRISATTGDGSISTDFGLPTQGNDNHRAEGTIGDGSGGSLTLQTGDGSIAIRKR